jgi:DNA mismatch repair protein MutS
VQGICFIFRQFFESVIDILKLQKEYNLTSPLVTNIQQTLQDPDIKEIISLLFTDTFKKKQTGYFFNYGKILYTQKKINEHGKKLNSLLQYIGELDAYRSIAAIYKEQEKTDKKLCFVEYINNQQGASLSCHNSWLALIPRESVIQDIHLGATPFGVQHMIITGPNWSGKSTFLKQTGLIAYIGQTLGIAPGTQCTMTIFDYMETCLDPEGNLSQGLSKFAKQKECVAAVERHIHECTDEKRGLFLIDEIFNGTVDDIIALKTIEFGENVAPNKNVIIQITTHIHEPITLEQTTQGLFKNFHVDILPQEDGSFIRTFKVVRGPATWWFDQSKKQLRAAFSDWIDNELKKKRQRQEAEEVIQ